MVTDYTHCTTGPSSGEDWPGTFMFTPAAWPAQSLAAERSFILSR